MTAPAHNMHITLRVASAMCFIGHGAFGFITKPIWCNYFAVAGIGHDLAYRLMPVVGTADILMGLSLLFYPTRAVLAWLVVWGTTTALMRPLSGEPFAEMIERAGNYGAPLALLVLSGRRPLLTRLDAHPETNEVRFARAVVVLRVVVFLLLAGHGWLNLIEKKGLLAQYTALGFSNPIGVAHVVGIFESVAAIAILVKPARPLVLILFVWKVGTELFYPHWELFEWVERSGSYGCLLALWLALGNNKTSHIHTNQILSAS